MNRFHTTLSNLIQSDLRSAAAIAREAGVSAQTISQVSSGIDCSAKILGKIRSAFPEDSAKLALLSAWMEDKAEEAGADADEILASLGSPKGLRIPASIRPAVVHLCALAPDTPSLVDLLNDLAMLTGQGQPKAKPEPAKDIPPALKAITDSGKLNIRPQDEAKKKGVV